MQLFKVYYDAKWDDNHKKHSHDHMRLEFLVFAKCKEDAIYFVKNNNKELDPSRFEAYEDELPYEVKEGVAILSANNSFDE